MLARRLGIFLSLFYLLSLVPPAFAHPMGNFSVNHYSRITLERDGIVIQYLVDLAEIPAYQELQQGNITATPNDPAVTRFIAARGAELGRGLILEVNGQQIPLRLISSGVVFPPGAGGLPTMKMGFVYEADYPPTPSNSLNIDRQQVSLRYADNNYPGHTGWKEIIALASVGSLLRSLGSCYGPQRRVEQLSNRSVDQPASGPRSVGGSCVAAFTTCSRSCWLPAAVTACEGSCSQCDASAESCQYSRAGCARIQTDRDCTSHSVT